MTIAVAGTANQCVVRGASAEWPASATVSALPSAAIRMKASNPYRRASDQRLLTPVNVLQPHVSRVLPK
jgi:hypothetical protein